MIHEKLLALNIKTLYGNKQSKNTQTYFYVDKGKENHIEDNCNL